MKIRISAREPKAPLHLGSPDDLTDPESVRASIRNSFVKRKRESALPQAAAALALAALGYALLRIVLDLTGPNAGPASFAMVMLVVVALPAVLVGFASSAYLRIQRKTLKKNPILSSLESKPQSHALPTLLETVSDRPSLSWLIEAIPTLSTVLSVADSETAESLLPKHWSALEKLVRLAPFSTGIGQETVYRQDYVRFAAEAMRFMTRVGHPAVTTIAPLTKMRILHHDQNLVRDAARELLPLMQATVLVQKTTAALLRPTEAPVGDGLLRPAAHTTTQEEVLLRPVVGGD